MMELWNAYDISSVFGFEQQREIVKKYTDAYMKMQMYCIALLIDLDGLKFKPKLGYLIRT